MEYNIKPKTTRYKGVNFRSRLEAKWACFFDLVGWKWQYEPCEINGYNPDFIITCKSDSYNTNKIIVEVKPSVFIDEDFKAETLKKYKNIPAHILILSDNPFNQSDNGYGNISIGVGSQYSETHHEEIYDIEMKDLIDDFGSEYMRFDGMITGYGNRKMFMKPLDIEHLALLELWIDAGNKTQFKVR